MSGACAGVTEDPSASIRANTIITLNSSGGLRMNDTGRPTLHCDCVCGGLAYDFSGVADPTGTDGNRNYRDMPAVARGSQSVKTEPKVWDDLQGGTAKRSGLQ